MPIQTQSHVVQYSGGNDFGFPAAVLLVVVGGSNSNIGDIFVNDEMT